LGAPSSPTISRLFKEAPCGLSSSDEIDSQARNKGPQIIYSSFSSIHSSLFVRTSSTIFFAPFFHHRPYALPFESVACFLGGPGYSPFLSPFPFFSSFPQYSDFSWLIPEWLGRSFFRHSPSRDGWSGTRSSDFKLSCPAFDPSLFVLFLWDIPAPSLSFLSWALSPLTQLPCRFHRAYVFEGPLFPITAPFSLSRSISPFLRDLIGSLLFSGHDNCKVTFSGFLQEHNSLQSFPVPHSLFPLLPLSQSETSLCFFSTLKSYYAFLIFREEEFLEGRRRTMIFSKWLFFWTDSFLEVVNESPCSLFVHT